MNLKSTIVCFTCMCLVVVAAGKVKGSKHVKPRDVEYTIVLEQQTWNQALDNCEAKQSRLATIRNIDEQNDILALITRKGVREALWVAGTRGRNADGFDWFVTKGRKQVYERALFTHWLPHEPDLKDENKRCVAMVPLDYQWKTANCDEAKSYICEKDVE